LSWSLTLPMGIDLLKMIEKKGGRNDEAGLEIDRP
jgi:hypothetical protein